PSHPIHLLAGASMLRCAGVDPVASTRRMGGHAVRVLFTCHSALGHFHPLVPIAQAMVDAGHEVAFATPASFAPIVERTGFRVFAAGMSGTPADVFPELRGLSGRDATAFMRARVRPAQAAAMATDL